MKQVSYSLLIFFCGMFITVDGFNKTGIPGKLWDVMGPYSQVDRVVGIVILALVILVLSNLVSNVPTGMDSACLCVHIFAFIKLNSLIYRLASKSKQP